MTRQKRLYYTRAVYHVCIRGNNRQYVLQEDEDKIAFLASLSKFKERFGFKLYALVLMDNHPHLIIEPAGPVTISKIMQAVALSYSFKFRKKYGYIGYVWQGRFKSNVISGGNYILACIEYIHNNPFRANIVARPEDYPWSSYHLYHGHTDPLRDYIALDRFKE
jgi:putative transposase